MVSGIHHVEIVVQNLEKSIAFYQDLLGFKVISRHPELTVDSEAIGLPGENTRLKWAFLRAGNDTLEIHEYLSPAGKPLQRRNCDIGIGHIALAVDDIHKMYHKLVKNGVKFNKQPQALGEDTAQKTYWVYLQDPDGITIELYQSA